MSPFLALHAVAAERGEGLLPELLAALRRHEENRLETTPRVAGSDGRPYANRDGRLPSDINSRPLVEASPRYQPGEARLRLRRYGLL